MSSLREIANWWERGKAEGAAFMIVVCDTFDYEDYPVYTQLADFWPQYDDHDGKNMQRIMEVYDFSKPWTEQTSGRVMNMPSGSRNTAMLEGE
jgi:hypothetical protein